VGWFPAWKAAEMMLLLHLCSCRVSWSQHYCGRVCAGGAVFPGSGRGEGLLLAQLSLLPEPKAARWFLGAVKSAKWGSNWLLERGCYQQDLVSAYKAILRR